MNMTPLELFQSFVAPAIFISSAGLLVLSINTRLMGMVTRLRHFHKEKHLAATEGKKQEVIMLQGQIESIQYRANKVKNAFFFMLVGVAGIMVTCLLMGLTLYVPEALIIAVIIFVISVLSMLVGTIYYISEVSVSLSSEKEEDKMYALMDIMTESIGDR